MVLIVFFVKPFFQHGIIRKEFQVLPDGMAHQPDKWIVPIDDTETFSPDHIYPVFLLYMRIFMSDNIVQRFFGVKSSFQKNSFPKRKRKDFLIGFADPDALNMAE